MPHAAVKLYGFYVLVDMDSALRIVKSVKKHLLYAGNILCASSDKNS
jgi:hypothetical protein